MSITTKKGDAGKTGMLFGERVSKSHPRMTALGATDELNAALGLVRIHLEAGAEDQKIEQIQRDLISAMGVLSVKAEDFPRYLKDGFSSLNGDHVERIENLAKQLESELPPMRDWVLPGSKRNKVSAHLDVARTTCRRAEASIVHLYETEASPPAPLLAYFNRLSDLLWLMARGAEREETLNLF